MTMNLLSTSRGARAFALTMTLLPVTAGFCAARGQAPRGLRPAAPAARGGQRGNQEHLPQWMARHQNLSPEQQQHALENEPGFRQLPPQTQQRMRDRLSQLNSMAPAQRSHVLERAEQMENLNPQQRQQVRGAMAQLGTLPPDRRRVVARAFRDMREMPPQQRQAFMGSEYLQRQLSPAERGTLRDLISIEPLLPAQRPAGMLPPPQTTPQ